MVMEQIVIPLVVPSQNHVYVLMLTVELETLTPSWAMSNAHVHHASTHAWEKLVILDQI